MTMNFTLGQNRKLCSYFNYIDVMMKYPQGEGKKANMTVFLQEMYICYLYTYGISRRSKMKF